MIRVAAVGDMHIGDDGSAQWRDAPKPVSDDADLLLLAGDLIRIGTTAEAAVVAAALELVSIPTLAVLAITTITAAALPRSAGSSLRAACACSKELRRRSRSETRGSASPARRASAAGLRTPAAATSGSPR